MSLRINESINLISWINRSIPNFVCQPPQVKYLDIEGKQRVMGLPAIVANMKAIAECWELARYAGLASIFYEPLTNELQVRLCGGVYSRNLQLTDGRIPMYGNKIPGINYGLPIVTTKLEEQLCDYLKVLEHAAKKVRQSYGDMITLGGVSTEDVPLLEAIQDKTLKDWEESRQLLVSEGSNLHNVTASISDLERVLRPFQEGISSEAGVPLWLIFPNKISSQFELEERDIWATSLFQSTVMPVLLNVLMQQGYDVVDISPPFYRDRNYQLSLDNLATDTLYKDSATQRNLSQVKMTQETLKQTKKINAVADPTQLVVTGTSSKAGTGNPPGKTL